MPASWRVRERRRHRPTRGMGAGGMGQGRLWDHGLPYRKINMTGWSIHHLKMYSVLLKMGIFQPFMLVFKGVQIETCDFCTPQIFSKQEREEGI